MSNGCQKRVPLPAGANDDISAESYISETKTRLAGVCGVASFGMESCVLTGPYSKRCKLAPRHLDSSIVAANMGRVWSPLGRFPSWFCHFSHFSTPTALYFVASSNV